MDAEEVLARCDPSGTLSDACVTDISRVLTDGPGPFLLSLMPLLLSLIAAWGLWLGRRAAWILVLAVNVVVAIVTAVGVGAGELFDAETRAAIGLEYVIWVVVAVVVLLIVIGSRYRVRTSRSAALRFALVDLGAFVVLAGGYVALVVLSPADALLLLV